MSPLVTAVLITAIGMALIFLALALFYALMTALTFQPRRRPSPLPEAASLPRSTVDDRALQAAAIAVALAHARSERPPETGELRYPGGSGNPPAADLPPVSPWWSLHHQRRLARHFRGERSP